MITASAPFFAEGSVNGAVDTKEVTWVERDWVVFIVNMLPAQVQAYVAV
jgi:hypothetical protein